MTQLSIGQVARQAGVSVETLRFYEKQGLLLKPARSTAGYRCYDSGVVRRVRFIQRAKELGFALREIAELLNLRQTRKTSCAQVRSVALAKVEDIDLKLTDLQRMRVALVKLAARCELEGTLGECPLLDALEDVTLEDNHAS